MKLLMAYRRWFIGGFLAVALGIVVWFAGPLLVLGDWRPLESSGVRLAWIALIAAVWLGMEAVRVLRARACNRKLTEGLAAGAETAAMSQQEAAALQQRFADALKTLRATRLGGSGRPRLLYQLPWYMFIGAPGSGKTTALVNSGLRFPLAKSGGGAVALGGVGGTRNCDWWFTEDAVLIDTAGRYTTQDSHSAVDQSAWLTFLGLLKRFRPRQPINGILATLSVGDLLSTDSQERHRYALAVRQRIDDLQRELGLAFPVYVLVTKCDLVAGFSEFFSTFDPQQRAQVWGLTFDVDLKTRTSGNPRAAFDEGFPPLAGKLNELLLTRLQEERDPERRAAMYPFPQQFAALAPLVSEFLDVAFAESKYSHKAIVRGVYFTSGTQEGSPIDRLLGSLSRSMDLRGGRPSQVSSLQTAGKSYFIGRLMTHVIFPEAGLAGHSEQREARLRRLNWGLVGLLSLAGVGLMAAWSMSFVGNREGLGRAVASAQSARQSLASVGPPAPGDLPVLLESLAKLGQVPLAVHDPVDSPPWSMRWGLYQGTKVATQVDERYRFALQQGLLPRVALQLEAIMASPRATPEAVYAALKTYLMLYDAKHFDEAFFVATVADLWQSSGLSSELVASGREHLLQLVRSRDLQVARLHASNDRLIASARDRAGGLSLVDRAYSLLRLTAGGATKDWRVSEVVGPLGVGVLERASGVSLSEPIASLYTREAYRDVVKPRARSIVAQLAQEESWVLGGRAAGFGRSNAQELEAALLRRYLSDYQATWDGLLRDVRLRPVEGMRGAMNAAQVLSQGDSPLKRLVQAVAEQTRLSATDVKSNAASAAEENAKRKARDAAANATTGIFGSQAAQVIGGVLPANDPVRAQELAVEEHFAALRRLAGDGKPGEIDAAMALLQEVFNELVAVQQKMASGQGMKEMPPGLAKAKAQSQRFNMPVAGIIKTLVEFTEQEASGGLRKEVKAGVGGASSICQRALPGRYPLVRSSPQDAGVQDFVNVFKAGGDLDSFFSASLAPYVDKSGGVWRLKASGEGSPPVSPSTLRQFQNADAIRTAFLNGGATPSVTVDVSLVSGDADLGIEYEGAVHKLRVGSPGARLTWPARPGARLLLGTQPLVSVEGPWALFRLVDKGTPDPASVGDRVRVSYGLPGGARALLEFRSASAAFNPLRLRELEAFSCPRE